MNSERIIAISQPYYFPWLGACEIYSKCDVYVFLDDVNFQKQGLNNRIKIKTSEGLKWMTLRLNQSSRHKQINETEIFDFNQSKNVHLNLFTTNYFSTPYFEDAFKVMQVGLSQETNILSDVAIASEKALFDFFEIDSEKEIHISSFLKRKNRGSDGILELVQALEGNVYLTAHGAINYLDHIAFEKAGIEVRYMNYGLKRYPQQFGEFTPFVSGLDAIANLGESARQLISAGTIPWRKFLKN